MRILPTNKFKVLSSYQIKLIALIAMTIDHLGAYGFEIPVFATCKPLLRIIGRIAAPLFLFALTESVRHTKNRRKFLLRLYLGAVGTGLFVAFTNLLLDDSIGRFSSNNIFFDFLYLAIYIILIEQIIQSVKTRNWKRGLLALIGIAGTCIPHFLLVLLEQMVYSASELKRETIWFLSDCAQSFLRSPLHLEYSLLFVLMGILMYFVRCNWGKALILAFFSGISYFGMNFGSTFSQLFMPMLGHPQYYMFLAAPFILLYSGEKGKAQKYFFYLYYPLHRYAISIIVYIYRLFFAV